LKDERRDGNMHYIKGLACAKALSQKLAGN
jgi:hypothetical protein